MSNIQQQSQKDLNRINGFKLNLQKYIKNLDSYKQIDESSINNIIECSTHSIYAVNHIVRTALLILKNTPHLKRSARKYQDFKNSINVYVISTMYPYPMPNNKIKISDSLNPDIMDLMSEFHTKPLVLASLDDNQQGIQADGKEYKNITILTNSMIQNFVKHILKIMQGCEIKGISNINNQTVVFNPDGNEKELK